MCSTHTHLLIHKKTIPTHKQIRGSRYEIRILGVHVLDSDRVAFVSTSLLFRKTFIKKHADSEAYETHACSKIENASISCVEKVHLSHVRYDMDMFDLHQVHRTREKFQSGAHAQDITHDRFAVLPLCAHVYDRVDEYVEFIVQCRRLREHEGCGGTYSG